MPFRGHNTSQHCTKHTRILFFFFTFDTMFCFSELRSQHTMELDRRSIKGIPKHVLLNSSPCALSHLKVWVIPLPPSVFSLLCNVGNSRLAHLATFYSVFFTCVLSPSSPSKSCSLGQLDPLLIFSLCFFTAWFALLLCLPFILTDGEV